MIKNLSLLLAATLTLSTPTNAHAADGKSFIQVFNEDTASGKENRAVYCAGFSGLRPTVTATAFVHTGTNEKKNINGVPTGTFFEEFKMRCKLQKKKSDGLYYDVDENGTYISCNVSALVNNDNSSEIRVKVFQTTTNGPLKIACTVTNKPIERA